jgi:hypothetical protein
MRPGEIADVYLGIRVGPGDGNQYVFWHGFNPVHYP